MKVALLVCLVSLVAFSSAKLVGGLSEELPVDDNIIRYHTIIVFEKFNEYIVLSYLQFNNCTL